MVNDKLLDVFMSYGIDKGIPRSLLMDILAKDAHSALAVSDRYNISLIVDGLDHNLDLQDTDYGKIVEISGTNMRFKTTSLLMISLILGCDWENQVNYINNYQLKSQLDRVKANWLSEDLNLRLEIKHDNGPFIAIKNGLHFQVINQGQQLFNEMINEEFFDKYQMQARKWWKVQFVSKGRDFVGQVHNEILSDFTLTIEMVRQRLLSILRRARYESLESESNIGKLKRMHENKIQIISSLLSIINELSISFNYGPEVLFRCLQYRSQVKKQDIVDKMQHLEKISEALKIRKEELRTYLEPYQYDSKQLNELDLFFKRWSDPANINIDISYQGSQLPKMYINLENQLPFKIDNINEFKKLLDLIQINQNEIVQRYDGKENYVSLINAYNERLNIEKQEEELNHQILDNEYQIKVAEILETYDSKSLDKIRMKYTVLAEQVQRILEKDINNYKQWKDLEEDLEMNLVILANQIKELEEAAKRAKEYEPVYKARQLLEAISAVNVFLESATSSFVADDLTISKKESAAKESPIINEVIKVFNDTMVERCKYYYSPDTQNNNKFEPIKILSYDFVRRQLKTDMGIISTAWGLSGGVDSAMTVRSLASCYSDAVYGNVVLVDEWGDVGSDLANAVYSTLKELPMLAFCCFVFVNDDNEARIIHKSL